jgi:hypothetical protein
MVRSHVARRYRIFTSLIAALGAALLFAASAMAEFGIQPNSLVVSLSTLQAGGHPDFTTTWNFNLVTNTGPGGGEVPDENVRHIEVELPPGLVGQVKDIPKCPFRLLASGNLSACPTDTQVGIAGIPAFFPGFFERVGLYDLTPDKGEPAAFGFSLFGVPTRIVVRPRPAKGYRLIATAEAPEILPVFGVLTTFWGIPGSHIHDEERLLPEAFGPGNEGKPLPSGAPTVPLMSNPSVCGEPLTTTVMVDSWQNTGRFLSYPSTIPGGLTGCNALSFAPALSAAGGSQAASPTALAVDLHVPQDESPNGVSTPDVKNTTVTLPAGLQVNPAAAGGLQACTESEIGYKGRESGTGTLLFEEESEAEETGEAPHRTGCPEASKLGKVTIKTPLLEEELTGSVYQAAQQANPFGSLLALYVIAEVPERGVRIKLAGEVKVEPNGQLVATFPDTPQLPFEDFKLNFFGGAKAPLATTGCGAYKTTSAIEPWSSSKAEPALAQPFSEFAVAGGPGGQPCSSLGGFAPGFVAGTQNNASSSFSPFVMNLTRKDGEQTLSTVGLKLPPGLSGLVSAVTLCPEAQANAGDCPAVSRIGHVRVSAGVGVEPIVLPEAGKPEDLVYLTGPYKGAPFGLSVVVPAEAGPFNLDEGGHPIVVRAKVEVDPRTAQVTVVSDPMPTRLQGIPLDVRDIEVIVDKPGFIFNPTNCNAMAVNGTIGAAEGASANVSSRYQAADCANLPFKPTFTVSTQGKTSKADGASLNVKLVSKGGPQAGGGEANIRAVKVDLPRQLPSRLTTLQKACTEAQFNANPAGCPAASDVGTASALTPIFSHPLTGPAYFVSHGGEAFPDLEIVLQGEGVTLILDGNTDIKKGITSSTFRTLPDAPISSFELKLPAGPYSILGTNLPASANHSLCGQKLAMPTAFVGQNGAVIHTSTPISVTGCKPAITVVGHSVKGKTATIVVSVPSAGRLVATGNGLSKATGRSTAAGTVTVKLSLTNGEKAFLAKHKGRKLKATIKLQFTPKKGAKLKTSTTVLIS